jgi:TolB-like protein
MKAPGIRVPAGVEAVVLRALRGAPEERPASARAFRDDLTTAFVATTRPRWRRGAIPAVVIAVLAAVLAIVWRPDRRNRIDMSHLDPRRVVVADFDNETADSAYADWGDVAGDIISTQLAKVPELQIVTSERWLARSHQAQRQPDPQSLRRVAAEVNAATVVAGGYYLNGGHVELVVEVTDARSGVLLRTYGPVAVSPKAPDSTVLALGSQVAAALDSIIIRRTGVRLTYRATPSRS